MKVCFWRKTFQSRRPHLIVALPPAADMVSLTFFNTTVYHISWIKYSVSYISQAYHILYIWTGSSPRLPSMWGSTCLRPTPSLSGQSRWQEQGTRSWWWNWWRFWIMLILMINQEEVNDEEASKEGKVSTVREWILWRWKVKLNC